MRRCGGLDAALIQRSRGRIHDGHVPANEDGRVVAVLDDGDAMQVVGDERTTTGRAGRAPGAARGRGERSIPSPAPMCTHWVGWLMTPKS